MKVILNTVLILLVWMGYTQDPEFRFEGIQLNVADLEQAHSYYRDVLGLEVERSSKAITVSGHAVPIVIKKAPQVNENVYPFESRLNVTFQVNKLLPAIDRLRKKGVQFYDSLLVRNGVGISIPFQDPFGNVLSLIEVQVVSTPPFQRLQVYNMGVTLSEFQKAISFYKDVLGFQEWTRNYLPNALPMKHRDGSFAFMLHFKKDLRPSKQRHHGAPGMILQLSCKDLSRAKTYLQSCQIPLELSDHSLICRDPQGNWVEIIQNN